MKRKYKKLTYYLVGVVMGVGMVTFPVGKGKADQGQDGMETSKPLAARPKESEAFKRLAVFGAVFSDKILQEAKTPAATPTPTLTPTPTPTPVPTLAPEKNVLLTEVPEDIVSFVEHYFSVRLNGTAEEYRALFYNSGELDEQLANRRVEYIVAYHNLKCYAKLGTGEVDYVVYVQNDVEVATIDTYAPSIDQLFIKYDKQGKPKLYLHGKDFTPDEDAYYEALRAAQDVAGLIADVNTRLEEAIASDEALRDFFVRLSQQMGEGE